MIVSEGLLELALPGASITCDEDEITSRIFHRKPCLRVESLVEYQDNLYALFRPLSSDFDGHRPRMVGPILPGFPLGEYAAQGGLALVFHLKSFERSKYTKGFQSINCVYLEEGKVQMIDRGVKPGDIVLFIPEMVKISCKPEDLKRSVRKLSARIAVYVIQDEQLILVAKCSMKGNAVFSRKRLVP